MGFLPTGNELSRAFLQLLPRECHGVVIVVACG